MLLAKDHEVVEAFLSKGLDESLDVDHGVRRAVGAFQIFNRWRECRSNRWIVAGNRYQYRQQAEQPIVVDRAGVPMSCVRLARIVREVLQPSQADRNKFHAFDPEPRLFQRVGILHAQELASFIVGIDALIESDSRAAQGVVRARFVSQLADQREIAGDVNLFH